MLDFRYLNAFVQTVRSGNFSAAALRLGVTPAAVSKWIAQLERQLDTRLFHRSSRRVSLTTEGRLFLDNVAGSMAGLDRAVELLHEARHEPAGPIRLSVMSGVARQVIIPLLPDFLHRYPKVSVDIHLNDGIVDPIRENLDIEIRRGLRHERSYIVRRLCAFPVFVVASPDYLARRGTPQTPDDLRNHECIGTRLSNGDLLSWDFAAAGAGKRGRRSPVWKHVPQGRFVVSGQIDASLRGAMAGLGIALSSAASAAPFLRSGNLQRILADYRLTEDNDVYLYYPHRDHLALKTRLFVDYICGCMPDGELPAEHWASPVPSATTQRSNLQADDAMNR